MKNYCFVLIFLMVSSICINTVAQETAENKADHDELRAMLKEGEKAINDGNIDALLKFFHPDANVIFPNMQVADGSDKIRDYYTRMFDKNNPVLQDISTKATVDVTSEIYGNTAVAYGSLLTKYSFTGGMELELPAKWTITLVKIDGLWKVVSLQFTGNLFDNPLLTKASASSKYFGIGGLIVGFVIGFFVFRFFRKKKA